MTLILAGFDHAPNHYDQLFVPKKSPSKIVSGLFAAADSAITTESGKTILNGFRKLHTVEARLFTPHFKSYAAFSGEYHQVIERTEILVGFSGSSLIAQHMLNGLTKHLGNLRLSLDPEFLAYKVYRDCDLSNPLLSEIEKEREDLCERFPPLLYRNLLNQEVLSSVIKHSLEKSLAGAVKYQLSEHDFQRFNTEMFSGFYCPGSGQYHLLSHQMIFSHTDDSGASVSFETTEVSPTDILVLGIKEKFEDPAKELYLKLLEEGNIPESVFKFLIECIESANSELDNSIAKPASLRTLVNGNVIRKNFHLG